MLNLTIANKTKLEAALKRAVTNHLTLFDSIPGSGVYTVNSSTDSSKIYLVVIVKENGLVKATCQCQRHERGLVCQHIALCVFQLKLTLTERAGQIALAGTCRRCHHYPSVTSDGLCVSCCEADLY